MLIFREKCNNTQVEPALSNERQIELFIRGISDIKINITGFPSIAFLRDAVNIARTKANSKFKPTRIPAPPSVRRPEYKIKQEQNNYMNNKKPQFNKKSKNKTFKYYKCGKTGHFANQCKEEINTITEQISFTRNEEELRRVSLYGVEHAKELEIIFRKMRENKLLAKLGKCQFFQVPMNEVSFSKLAGSSIVVPSPPVSTAAPRHGQAVTQLPIVLPRTNRGSECNNREGISDIYLQINS
ncbi:hypothetical protein ACTFIV_002565 [Dictyostelium citrinum]